MTPYYSEDGITIYHGDCADLLPEFVGTVDALITDPPWGLGKTYNGTDEAGNMAEIGTYEAWFRPFIRPMFDTLRPGGFYAVWQPHAYLRHAWEWFGDDIHIYAAAKNYVQIRKTLPFVHAWEPIIAGYTSGAPFRRPETPSRSHDFHLGNTAGVIADTNAPERRHPYPRPIDTCRVLVDSFTLPGGLVLDPFMGSGTTLKAAKDTGRRAIGIEIEERYCEIAAQRLAQGVLPLFTPSTR